MKNLKQYSILTASAFILSGCATSLVDRSPLDIASDSFRRVDSLSGSTEIVAPIVEPILNKKTYIDAEANLRTAGPVTLSNGRISRDGAYIDILLSYTTATPDPNEARLYDQVSFAGGQAAEIAHFGGTITDCRQEVIESNHYSYYGYYPYYGYNGSYWGHNPGYHPNHKPGHKPNRPGGGHHGDHDHDDGAEHHHKPGHKPRDDRDRDPDRNRERDRDRDRGDETENRNRDRRKPGYKYRPKMQKPVIYHPKPKSQPMQNNAALPVSTPKTVTTPKAAPSFRQKPIKRTMPKPTRNKITRPKTVDRAFRKTRNRRTNSSPFKQVNIPYYPGEYYSSGQGYPGYQDYSVRYRCERQETLRVFVPRERLDIAQNSGLLLYLRPRAGYEETLILPSNYVAGFKLAAYAPDAQSPAQTLPPRPVYPANYRTLGQSVLPTPEISAPVLTPNTSSNAPIIYGTTD